MSLATLLALAIGIILLVIVLAIIISEYRWWRGRRLGVYAPPPPKAPAK
jgi:DMSO/TMAO reductase YedYZ heme-binding membrane subunit